MPTTLTPDRIQSIRERLGAANRAFSERFPGDRPDRQPVHTVYGGAHLFKAETAQKMGKIAVRHFEQFAPTPETFTEVFGIPAELAGLIHGRVRDKLSREAVEDFRIDFEDGYGNRPDAEEDGQAVIAAEEVAKGIDAGTLPPFLGIRVKPLTEELAARSIRTLDLFITTLSERSGGRLPPNFVVTLPKVTHPEQVEAIISLFEILEAETALPAGSLKVELMIETTQAIINAEGRIALPGLIEAGKGRVSGCHFGTYDYTATCNVTAAYQTMGHPACDFATHTMQVALAQTGVWMSDGATTIMPVPVHRAKAGESLSEAQERDNREAAHRAWKIAFDNNMHSLTRGIYQGWDLHPGQLVARYAAVYTFFLESLAAASHRLKHFMNVAAQATLVGDTFDDAATGQGLLNYFLRALNCGAVTEDEVKDTGLTLEELRSRSFVKILGNRRGAA